MLRIQAFCAQDLIHNCLFCAESTKFVGSGHQAIGSLCKMHSILNFFAPELIPNWLFLCRKHKIGWIRQSGHQALMHNAHDPCFLCNRSYPQQAFFVQRARYWLDQAIRPSGPHAKSTRSSIFVHRISSLTGFFAEST